jgi:hypothetical protein
MPDASSSLKEKKKEKTNHKALVQYSTFLYSFLVASIPFIGYG